MLRPPGHFRTGAIAASTLIALSCSSSTTNLSTWKDTTEPFTPYEKVVVASRQEPLGNRRLLENTIVEEFQKAGVDAVASLDILPPDKAERDTIRACIGATKAGGVMIITPLDKEDIVVHVPQRTTIVHPDPYHSYVDYWDLAEITTEGGYNEKVGELETRKIGMWDCSGDRLVWQGESETDVYDNPEAAARSLAKKLVRQLVDERIVMPAGRAER